MRGQAASGLLSGKENYDVKIAAQRLLTAREQLFLVELTLAQSRTNEFLADIPCIGPWAAAGRLRPISNYFKKLEGWENERLHAVESNGRKAPGRYLLGL